MKLGKITQKIYEWQGLFSIILFVIGIVTVEVVFSLFTIMNNSMEKMYESIWFGVFVFLFFAGIALLVWSLK